MPRAPTKPARGELSPVYPYALIARLRGPVRRSILGQGEQVLLLLRKPVSPELTQRVEPLPEWFKEACERQLLAEAGLVTTVTIDDPDGEIANRVYPSYGNRGDSGEGATVIRPRRRVDISENIPRNIARFPGKSK